MRAVQALYRHDTPRWILFKDSQNPLVIAENGSSEDTVFVDGRIVVEGRRNLAFDADAILAEAHPMMATILARNARLHAQATRMSALIR